MSQQENKKMAEFFYRASAADFKKIPGRAIAYWSSSSVKDVFLKAPEISSVTKIRQGMATTNDDKFLRLWHEVSLSSTCFNSRDSDDAIKSNKRWFPFLKGGEFRKWYGNNSYLVNFANNGSEVCKYIDSTPGAKVKSNGRVINRVCYFKETFTWSLISTANSSFRYTPNGFVLGHKGPGIYADEVSLESIGAYLNSKVSLHFLKVLSPTIGFEVGQVSKLPYIAKEVDCIDAIAIGKKDWDSYEVSWDFVNLPLLHLDYRQPFLSLTIQNLLSCWQEKTQEMQRLEEENNRLFIDAYGLQDELTPEVPLSEITLTCNPHYRYGGNLADEEREARLQSDTICELISYAIGCMMGRYSLDREGLVYAHAGNEGFKALVEEGAYATFAADDGILPLSTDSWFEDDVATRLEGFVCTVWGKETLEENLQFIADSLCLAAIKPVKKGGETSRETLRRYLSTQFFKDHMKTYKKRPIYWLFSSGKEKAFECLVYLHRYNEATLPRMRTEYVTPLLGQMAGRIERLRLQQTEASTSDAKRIGKEIDSLTKQLSELRAFDDQLKHHADMRITLDLDDGVKVNYGKFGTLLSDVKAITGDKGE